MSREKISLEGKTPERFAREASKKIVGVFAVRKEFNEVNSRRHKAEEEATSRAPEGYVFKITALSDGALTSVRDEHKPKPRYQERKSGEAVYAPTIDCHSKDGYTWSTYTTWLNGPLEFDLPSYVVDRTPAKINNENIRIELVSIEELNTAARQPSRT